jgi:hypothetical protein
LSNAVGLFVDDGRRVRRVKPADFSGAKVHIDIPINSRGRIWAEPISRMREFTGLDTLGELPFCLLPECLITWPDRLYRFRDKPEISLVAKDDGVSLEIENAEPIVNITRVWRVMPGIGLAQGYLKSGNIKVPLAHRIFRADIHKRSEARTPYIVLSDFQNPVSLVVAGIPRTKAEIALTDGAETRRLGELGIFNEAGNISFSTFAIRDALSGYGVPVGQFVVMDGALEIKTDTLFVNCDAIYEWITNPTSTTDMQWLPLLPSPIAEIFVRTLQVRDAPPKKAMMPVNADAIPECLIRLFESFRHLCFVFDGSEFPDHPDATVSQIVAECQAENQEMGASISWFIRAKKVFDAVKIAEGNNAEALLTEYSGLSWQPPFQRWRDKIELILHHLRADVEVLPLVDEWKKDVERE